MSDDTNTGAEQIMTLISVCSVLTVLFLIIRQRLKRRNNTVQSHSADRSDPRSSSFLSSSSSSTSSSSSSSIVAPGSEPEANSPHSEQRSALATKDKVDDAQDAVDTETNKAHHMTTVNNRKAPGINLADDHHIDASSHVVSTTTTTTTTTASSSPSSDPTVDHADMLAKRLQRLSSNNSIPTASTTTDISPTSPTPSPSSSSTTTSSSSSTTSTSSKSPQTPTPIPSTTSSSSSSSSPPPATISTSTSTQSTPQDSSNQQSKPKSDPTKKRARFINDLVQHTLNMKDESPFEDDKAWTTAITAYLNPVLDFSFLLTIHVHDQQPLEFASVHVEIETESPHHLVVMFGGETETPQWDEHTRFDLTAQFVRTGVSAHLATNATADQLGISLDEGVPRLPMLPQQLLEWLHAAPPSVARQALYITLEHLDCLFIHVIQEHQKQHGPNAAQELFWLFAEGLQRAASFKAPLIGHSLSQADRDLAKLHVREALVRYLASMLADTPALGALLYQAISRPSVRVDKALVQSLSAHMGEHAPVPYSALVLAIYEATDHLTLESDAYWRPAEALHLFSADETFATVLVNSPALCGGGPNPQALVNTLLGRLLSLSPIPEHSDSVMRKHFANLSQRTLDDVEASKRSLADAMDTIDKIVFPVIENLVIRHRTSTREPFLEWLELALVGSKPRLHSYSQDINPSGDASALNLSRHLIQLCKPLLLRTQQPPQRLFGVDALFCLGEHPHSRFLDSQTRLGADTDELTHYVSTQGSPDSFKLSTRLFFLALFQQHVGFAPVITHVKDLAQHMQRMHQGMSRVPEQMRAMVKANLEATQTLRIAMEAHLLNDNIIDLRLQFGATLAVYLMHLADPEHNGLPLPASPTMAFRCLPEFVVEDLCDLLDFLCDWQPERIAGSTWLRHLVEFVITFCGNAAYIKNPYLRSQLVKVLHSMIEMENQGGASSSSSSSSSAAGNAYNESLRQVIKASPLVRDHIVASLAQLFCDVENTGRTNQFYERFYPRHHVMNVFAYLWPEHSLRDNFRDVFSSELGVNVLNFVLNDSTLLLDEIFTCVMDVKAIQEQLAELEEAQQSQANAQEQVAELQQQLHELERQLQSKSLLSMEYMDWIHYVSAEVATPFIDASMVDRLAVMLCYYLDKLAGPKRKELKIQDMSKYHFKPATLLTQIAEVFINLARHEQFQEAVANDGRSYSHELLMEASDIMAKHHMLAAVQVEQFVHAAEAIHELHVHNTEDTREIPPEYECSIMYELMSDPVRLPSGNVVDRKNIERMWRDKPVDPFTNLPMTMEDVTELPELKEEIKEWRAQA